MTAWSLRLGTVRGWRVDRAAYALLVVSLSINVVLARERRGRGPDHRPSADELVGTVLPAISVTAADGSASTLTWNDGDTVLYYFHPDCRWCQRNADAVAALERQTRGRFAFAAVTTARYDAHPARVPTYWAFGDGERRRLHLSGTPQTLVVARGGRVLQSFAGAYTGTTRQRMERFFQVALPEIAPATQPTR